MIGTIRSSTDGNRILHCRQNSTPISKLKSGLNRSIQLHINPDFDTSLTHMSLNAILQQIKGQRDFIAKTDLYFTIITKSSDP